MKSTPTSAAREPQSRYAPLWALELAYQQGEQELIKEEGRELTLRRLFFSSYIIAILALAGWGIYFCHLYKLRLSPGTGNRALIKSGLGSPIVGLPEKKPNGISENPI